MKEEILYFLYQVIFLDDSSQNLKPAREMGMTTILVKNPITALKDLQKVTGIDVSFIQLEWFLPSLSLWIHAFRTVALRNRQSKAVLPLFVYSHDNYLKYLGILTMCITWLQPWYWVVAGIPASVCARPLFLICPLAAHLCCVLVSHRPVLKRKY